jgi:uncharacterized repeat protein (TIGR03806 family)
MCYIMTNAFQIRSICIFVLKFDWFGNSCIVLLIIFNLFFLFFSFYKNMSAKKPLPFIKTFMSTVLSTALMVAAMSPLDGNSQNVLTYQYDNTRDGANTNELLLTPANVNVNSFGKLFTYTVDGYVYAQPLVMTNVTIPGQGTHNVVFVATEHDSIYAFDADSNAGANGGLLWHTNLGISALSNNHEFGSRYNNGNYTDLIPEIGITGTPVIDAASGTLYVDVLTREVTTTTNYYHRIHALDITTGNERPYSPVVVTASVPGKGVGSSGGVVTFNAQQQLQRPALTLAGGMLYVAYGSYADTDPYHGWIIGFNATNLQEMTNYIFNTTPNATTAAFGGNAGEGALWMGGDGLCVDASNNLYFETANGSFSANTNGGDYGDSFIKLSTTNGLRVADYFTPYNQLSLANGDEDLGSGGPILLPVSVGSVGHTNLLVGCGKEGKIYLLDRGNLGHYNGTDGINGSDGSAVVQEIPNAVGGVRSSPAYFNNQIYYQGSGDVMKAFLITNGVIVTTPKSKSTTSYGSFGATPVVSANGTNKAIAWSTDSGAFSSSGPAVLHAYNATNLAQELYNSSQNLSRDNPGGAIKMTTPTEANGKVYVGAEYALSVFGLATFLPAPTISPNGGIFTNSVTITMSDTATGASIYYTLNGTTPTTNSILYTNSFVLTNTAAVQAIATEPGQVNSAVTAVNFLNSSAIGSGTGLLGAYYSNQLETFNGPATLVRIDPTINFNWGTGSPDPSISVDDFTVRWTGSVQPQYNETYTFYTTTDDGVRLWVNGQLLIDDWVDQAATTESGSITLKAQQLYNIQMDYYEDGGSASAQLQWSSPSTPKAVIPQSQLNPYTNPPPTVILSSPTNGATYTATASVTIGAMADAPYNPINQVAFYANGSLLGTITNSSDAPLYTLTTTGLSAGSYVLTAVATDGSGLSSTSAPVNITVAAGSGLPYGLTPGGNFGPAQLIDVQFNGNSVSTADGGGGPDPGPVQSGAALIGSAGDVWNSFNDSSFTFSAFPGGVSANGLMLNYANGGASGVTMSLTGDGTYDAESFGNDSPFVVADSPYQNLMQAELFANNPQTITLSGLGANQTYNLILYSSGDNNVGTGRTNTFTVNGVKQTSIWNGTDSTLIAGRTYVEFPSAMTDGSGNLVIQFGVTAGTGGLETDLNGFQLVAVSGNSPAEVPAFFNMPTTFNGALPPLLSETGVFSNTPSMTPANGLIPYQPNVILWSDGAQKIRYMAVPNNGGIITPDQQIDFAPTGTWTFPAGTIFVKTFELQTNTSDPTSLRRLETRLLVRDINGAVYGVTYKWRPDYSDADLLTTSSNENIAITTPSGVVTQTWYYPSPADCLSCHTPVANYVLGVSTRQLNANFTYPSTGVTDNELRTLNRLGLFNPAFNESNITNFEKLSALTNLTASFEDRARSYLDANCAQCHQPGGTGPTFDARYETPLALQNITNMPAAKGNLGVDNAMIVMPDDIWRSVLYGRMNTVDPSIKMPNLARNLIDTNAVAVMADWINSLPGTLALAPPTITPNGGMFATSVNVTLQSTNDNATLYYTLDGSLPTTNSFLYSAPFSLTNDAVVTASAFWPSFNNSVATSAFFTVQPLLFTSATFTTNDTFQLGFFGTPGSNYVLQASTNLLDWTPLSTNLAPTNLFNLYDPNATNFPYRFYRVLQQ